MAVITTLILTRHGEAHCNVDHIVGGDIACTGLTARGIGEGASSGLALVGSTLSWGKG